MIYEIDPSITTREDLRPNSDLASAADLAYTTSQSGLRTAIPSSVAYLPFSHFVSTNELSALASSYHLPTTPTHNLTARERILVSRLSSTDPLGQIEFNFDTSNYSPYFHSQPNKKYATMLQMLQYPFSKGSVHIPAMKADGKPTTSDDKPIIDPQYYSGRGGPIDFAMMSISQKFAAKICATKPLSDIIISRVFPPEQSHHDTNGNDLGNAVESEEDFSAWVRDTTITDWHPVGTCAMGPYSEDGKDGYVVDSRLRVHGVQGLRVVDASIMPLQVSAHIQATVYAIGEKGASMILEDWVETQVGRTSSQMPLRASSIIMSRI